MRIRVQYTAQLRSVVGRPEDDVDFRDGATLAEFLHHLGTTACRETKEFLLTTEERLQQSMLVAVNSKAIATESAHAITMRSGDVVTLLAPIAGG